MQNELKKDSVATKELSTFVGSLVLRCGRLLAVADTAMITAKHVDFRAAKQVEGEQISAKAE